MKESRLRLITRGDDAGLLPCANRAIFDAVKAGMLKNISFLTPAPAFEQAATCFAAVSDLCFGVHITLTAEWRSLRWGPVAPHEQVPTLVDDEGLFAAGVVDLYQRGIDPDEVEIEVRAQLAKARAAGLNIRYFDDHMAFGSLPGMRQRLERIAEQDELIFTRQYVKRLPVFDDLNYLDGPECLLAVLQRADPDTYLLAGHPMYPDPEAMSLCTCNNQPGAVARRRDEQRKMFMDPRVIGYIKDHDISVISFTEAALKIAESSR